MILSDRDIQTQLDNGQLIIDPFDPARLQPASYDVTLSPRLRRFCAGTLLVTTTVDTKYLTEEISIPNGGYYLAPGECVIASTVETFVFPHDLVGRFEGRSSLGRIFLSTHITAGFFDPGFSGTATLELKNESSRFEILLTPGMPIGQMSFHRLSTPAARPYGHPHLNSRYQHQTGPTPARALLQPESVDTPHPSDIS